MGLDSGPLRSLPSFIFLALGLLSQTYLVRRFRLPGFLTWALIAVEAVLMLISRESLYPTMLRFFPSGYSMVTIGGGITLWWWTLTATAALIWLRDKLVKQDFQPARRAWLKASATAVCAAPVVALSAGIATRKHFTIEEIDLHFPNLPKDLQGLRLLQISDIHMSDFFSAADLSRAVAASNELRPDIAFVTGDLITTQWDPLDQCLLELAKLRASSGVWGCLGNHEMHAHAERYTTQKALEYDIRFLRQGAVPLRFGQSQINLVGVDHQRRERPYLQRVEELVTPGGFNLLLSHNPDVFPVAARKGFQLTLAGHTHGGQINLPIGQANLNIADLITPFTKGAYKLPGSSLYVNAGLGTIGVPVRLGAPPEITLIRLCDSSS